MSFEFRLPSLEEMRATSDGLDMLRMIDDDDDFHTAIITGCPGSGKTTVSIRRLIRLAKQEVNVRLVTYQKLLAFSISNLATRNLAQLRTQNIKVSTFHSWYWELDKTLFSDNVTAAKLQSTLDRHLAKNQEGELLIDEGQDLPEVVYQVLPLYFQRTIVSADNAQQVHKNGATAEMIKIVLERDFSPCTHFQLSRNFRNSYQTYRFARQFIPKTNLIAWDETILKRLQRSKRHGPKPLVVGYQSIEQRNEHLRIVLDNADGNVGILCPFATPRQSLGDSVDEVYDLIIAMKFNATKYHNKTSLPDNSSRYIVTTFISAKGIEFDTVVIPRINYFNAIPEQWYVACTRTSGRLIVYRDLSVRDYDPIDKLCDADTYDTEVAHI